MSAYKIHNQITCKKTQPIGQLAVCNSFKLHYNLTVFRGKKKISHAKRLVKVLNKGSYKTREGGREEERIRFRFQGREKKRMPISPKKKKTLETGKQFSLPPPPISPKFFEFQTPYLTSPKQKKHSSCTIPIQKHRRAFQNFGPPPFAHQEDPNFWIVLHSAQTEYSKPLSNGGINSNPHHYLASPVPTPFLPPPHSPSLAWFFLPKPRIRNLLRSGEREREREQ